MRSHYSGSSWGRREGDEGSCPKCQDQHQPGLCLGCTVHQLTCRHCRPIKNANVDHVKACSYQPRTPPPPSSAPPNITPPSHHNLAPHCPLTSLPPNLAGRHCSASPLSTPHPASLFQSPSPFHPRPSQPPSSAGQREESLSSPKASHELPRNKAVAFFAFCPQLQCQFTAQQTLALRQDRWWPASGTSQERLLSNAHLACKRGTKRIALYLTTSPPVINRLL